LKRGGSAGCGADIERWTTDMPTLSQNLQHTLRHACANAAERREERATLEHLLLSLIDDADAAEVMRACGVDLDVLRDRVTGFLPDPKDGVTFDGDGAAELGADVNALLQRAMTHVTSAGREIVTGAGVLLQIFDEPTAHFLLEQGMNRYDAMMYISHGIAKMSDSAQSGGGAPSQNADATEAAGQASMFRVLLLNDDFTPMEFVVHVLEQIFERDRETAVRTMLHIHNHGRGACGTCPFAAAYAKAKAVEVVAREHGHPLRCVVEAAQSG
jgi:ATP-dependent Clp protease adapter protein ClpS